MSIDYICPSNDLVLTPNQIREFQQSLEAVAQSFNYQHKIIVLPPGTTVYRMDSEPDSDDVRSLLIRQLAGEMAGAFA